MVYTSGFRFSEADYQQMLNAYSSNKAAISFISNYLPSDISAVRLNTDSANIWSISPPDRQRMVEEIKSCKYFSLMSLL